MRHEEKKKPLHMAELRSYASAVMQKRPQIWYAV